MIIYKLFTTGRKWYEMTEEINIIYNGRENGTNIET